MRHDDLAVHLTDCDREPIHVPGGIQPHGVLLAIEPQSLEIMQCSDNVARLWAMPPEAVLGRRLSDVVHPAEAELLRSAFAGHDPSTGAYRVTVNAQAFDVALHRYQGLAILEFEPSVRELHDLETRLVQVIRTLQAAESLQTLFRATVTAVRALSGFDRVMLYRFNPDEHGEVIEEERDAEMEPYLGLHYPASDIPRQARELYLKNWLRIIPEAQYAPSAVVPLLRPDSGRPLDLSFSVLRSVSPVHRQYMANMGVRASMSISLIVHGELWGLISCGHRTPHHVSQRLRTGCELIGRLVSLQIGALQALEAKRQRDERQAFLAAARAALQGAPDIVSALAECAEPLLDLVGATGAAIVADGACQFTTGQVPSQALVEGLVEWLRAEQARDTYHTYALSSAYAPAAPCVDVASGLLAISLPRPGANAVLWFRPELTRTVIWGGDPHKPIQTEGGLRPRDSFEHWKELLKGQSQRWSAVDVEMASDLRRSITESDLAAQVLRARAAVKARDELVAVVSHDLRNPLGVIKLQLAVLDAAAPATGSDTTRRARASLDAIGRSAERMLALVDDLLDLAKIEVGRFTIKPEVIDADVLLRDNLVVLQPLAEAKGIEVKLESDTQLSVHADSERIFQVVSNIMSNAIKFTPVGGCIHIMTTATDTEVTITISDTGTGVSAKQLDHMFDRYWQVRQTATQGTGLGLYIAKGIVEAHGGRIWADSTPGEGTTVGFTLRRDIRPLHVSRLH